MGLVSWDRFDPIKQLKTLASLLSGGIVGNDHLTEIQLIEIVFYQLIEIVFYQLIKIVFYQLTEIFDTFHLIEFHFTFSVD